MLTLTAEGCKARREKLIASTQADLFIINNPRHIFYFSGLFVTQLLLSGWGLNSLLIDSSTGKTTLIIQNNLKGQAGAAQVDEVIDWLWYDGGSASISGVDLFGGAVDALNQQIVSYAGKRIGVEMGWLPFGAKVDHSLDINPAILALRRQKHPDELALIREAIAAVEAGHRAARDFIRPGVTEIEVYNAIESAIVQQLGHPVQMLGDFVSGERAQGIGGFPTHRQLGAGEVMILDLFPIVNGYRADFTATVPVTDSVSDAQQKLDLALNEALRASEALLKPGTIAGDVYRAVRNTLDQHGFADHFPHHAGHGLGLDHPEAPFFIPESREVLQVGDVVTVEPGAYGDGFAGRIENNYRITDSGFEKLTHHKTTLF
jgi:Xaa-Pro aminopeptidase